jgi:hypothetical protein
MTNVNESKQDNSHPEPSATQLSLRGYKVLVEDMPSWYDDQCAQAAEDALQVMTWALEHKKNFGPILDYARRKLSPEPSHWISYLTQFEQAALTPLLYWPGTDSRGGFLDKPEREHLRYALDLLRTFLQENCQLRTRWTDGTIFNYTHTWERP